VSGMGKRLLLAAALAACALSGTASAAGWRSYQVPTGGFKVALPASWEDITSATPALIKALGSNPALKSSAQLASQTGAIKLVAIEPAGKGLVYMDAWVARLGPVKLSQVEQQTVGELQQLANTKGKVQATTVKLPAGTAIVTRFRFTQGSRTEEAEAFTIVHDQVGYAFAYGAPAASWSKYASLFEASARTFRILPGPDLSRVILKPAQVGAGYKLAAYPGGDSIIGEATLDLCDGTYPSESLRTGRLQVAYKHPGHAVGVSNEVVTYVAGGAQQALGEVTKVARACARKTVVRKANGVTTTFRATLLSTAKLPPGSVAVRILTTETEGKKHFEETSVAIYQVKGNTLSGTYTFVAAGTTAADAIRVCYHAAAQSTINLGGSALTA
jgi:hypothetical protein